jgi:hypothetical protein
MTAPKGLVALADVRFGVERQGLQAQHALYIKTI